MSYSVAPVLALGSVPAHLAAAAITRALSPDRSRDSRDRPGVDRKPRRTMMSPELRVGSPSGRLGSPVGGRPATGPSDQYIGNGAAPAQPLSRFEDAPGNFGMRATGPYAMVRESRGIAFVLLRIECRSVSFCSRCAVLGEGGNETPQTDKWKGSRCFAVQGGEGIRSSVPKQPHENSNNPYGSANGVNGPAMRVGSPTRSPSGSRAPSALGHSYQPSAVGTVDDPKRCAFVPSGRNSAEREPQDECSLGCSYLPPTGDAYTSCCAACRANGELGVSRQWPSGGSDRDRRCVPAHTWSRLKTPFT